MKKALIIFSFFIYFFYFSLSSVFAQTNFKTDYNVAYNVLENALTHVTFDVTLTNQTSQYYASSYAIQVGFENIENVLASDSQGKIVPKVTKNNDGNNIELTFNDRVVGLDKKLTFKISFDTKDIAQKSGKIWDINIPGLAKQIEYNSFNVKVIVPKFLGNPSYIKPDIGKFDGANLNFTKEELGESGISISFGNEEIYEFDLLYHLKNPNLFPVKTEIALPPTTNYQEVQVQEIDPKPQNVIEDSDGNWLAQYVLAPSKKIDIRVKGQAKIMLHPKKQEMSDREENIDLGRFTGTLEMLHLKPDNPKTSADVKNAIVSADLIIAGPGDLYSTILPVLLVPGIIRTIKKSKAKKLYIVNVANKLFETPNYKVQDYILAIAKHCGDNIFDFVLTNSNISPVIPDKYKRQYEYVSLNYEKNNAYSVIFRDIINTKFPLYHDSIKLAKAIMENI